MLKQYTLTFFCFLLFAQFSIAQNSCGCGACAFPVANGAEQTLFINISNAQNNDLSAANQGLCRVSLDFSHNMVNEFEIELHSPTGQSIRLLPSKIDSNLTPLGRWVVDFVPCDSIAIPDTPYVANFGQNIWGQYQRQIGSYYPSTGCLEDFNAGTVNGSWRLVLRESDSTIWAGVLTKAYLEFCDMTGVNCSVGTPQPIPASNCTDAEFAIELNNHFGSTYGSIASDSTTGFCGITDNEQWVSFVAPSSDMQITVVAGNCQIGNGLQAAVYQACDAPPLACAPGEANGISIPNVLNLNNLNIGNTYFLLVDGFAGDECEFLVQSSQNTSAALGNPSIPAGNSSVCVPSIQSYETLKAFNTNGYKWTISGDGTFNANGQKTLFQIGTDPSPVDVEWNLNAGFVCVQSFANGDTSQAVCRGVLSDTIVRIELPFMKLCEAQLPYQPPFMHPTVSQSGTYSAIVESFGGCDTLFQQTISVSTAPTEIIYPSIILANDQCFTLPDGSEVCEAGAYEVSIDQFDGCTTLHRFSINTIDYTPVTLACAPVVVPFEVSGPDSAAIQWDFTGGMLVDTGGLIQAVYQNPGFFGFSIVVNGETYTYEGQFGVQAQPQAEIALQLQGALLTAANSGIGNPTLLEWTFGDGYGATGNPVMHEYMNDGLYTITLFVENPCGTDTDTTTIQYGTISTNKPFIKTNINLFPNPARSHFYLKTTGKKGQVQIINTQGKICISQEINNASFVPNLIKTDTLLKGIYQVVWRENGGRILSRKLVID